MTSDVTEHLPVIDITRCHCYWNFRSSWCCLWRITVFRDVWQLTTWHDSPENSNVPCACTVLCIQNIICSGTVDIMAQDSSVYVVTRQWAVWLQNQSMIPCSSRDFFHCIQTGFQTTSAMCTEGLLSGVIQASHSSCPLTSCTLVENAWSCTSTPLYVFAVWYNVRNGISLPLQLNTFCLYLLVEKSFLITTAIFVLKAMWYSAKICVQTVDVFVLKEHVVEVLEICVSTATFNFCFESRCVQMWI